MVWSLPFLSSLLCYFTNDVSISLTRHLGQSTFPSFADVRVKFFTMPDHRPYAPYVDVPKWERMGVLIWRLFIYEIGDLSINQIKISVLLV